MEEGSWKVYAIAKDNGNPQGILIRHSVWKKQQDFEYLQENHQQLNFEVSPQIVSDNTYCSTGHFLWEAYQRQFFRGSKVIASSNFDEDSSQTYYLHKQVYMQNGNSDFQVGLDYPLCYSNLESWINTLIEILQRMIQKNEKNVSRICLDYICPLNIYKQYIWGE